MINKIFCFLLFVSFITAGCVSSKKNIGKDSLQGKELLPYGRAAITNENLELISSAVHFGFSFQGDDCKLYASLPQGMDHNYLQYELDGVYQKRIKVTKDQKEIVLQAKAKGRHTVWIYKAKEVTT